MFRWDNKDFLTVNEDKKFLNFDDDDIFSLPSHIPQHKKLTKKIDNEIPKRNSVSNKLVSFLHKFDFQRKDEDLEETSLNIIIKDNEKENELQCEDSLARISASTNINDNEENVMKTDIISDLSADKNKELFENKSLRLSASKIQSCDSLINKEAVDDDDAFFDDDISFDVFINYDCEDGISRDNINNESKDIFQKTSAAFATTSVLRKNDEKISTFDEEFSINPFSNLMNTKTVDKEQQITETEKTLGVEECENVWPFNEALNLNKKFQNTSNFMKSSKFSISNETSSNRSFKIFSSNTNNNIYDFKENKYNSELSHLMSSSTTNFELCKPNKISSEIQEWQTPVQTSKLVSNFGSCKSRKRKFPGPAGLLPDLPPNSPSILKEYEHSLHLNNTEQSYNQELLSSQGSDNDFLLIPWISMTKDLGSQCSILLKNFNIKVIKMKAAKKKLPKFVEVPFFCVLVKSVSFNNTDVKIIFKDETGEIPGKVEQEINDKFGKFINVGSIFVLKKAKFLLNQLFVKLHNLIRIYDHDGSVVDVSDWDYINTISYDRNSISPNNKVSETSCSKFTENEIQDKPSSEPCGYIIDFADEDSVFEDDFNDIMCSIDESSFIS